MVTQSSLCELPSEPASGCCDLVVQPLVAPLTPNNPPGLSVIRYRIGTFSSFRRAMLNEVADPDLLKLFDLKNPVNPFAKWHEGTDGDYQTMLIELWAYLADILTFYQERIANEAYLPTATQRDSLLRLAQLINYHPSPGAGAGVSLAFTVEKGRQVSIQTGFRVGSKAQPGKPTVVFETEAATLALGEHSAIPLSSVAPTNQFAPLSAFGSLFGQGAISGSSLAIAAANLYGTAGAAYAKTFASSPASTVTASSSSRLFAETSGASFVYSRFLSLTKRTIVLKGINNRLAVGDYVLVVEKMPKGRTNPTLRQITTVNPDKTTDITTITWNEEAGTSYDKDSQLYAFRVTAGPFGNNAPNWYSLPFDFTNDGGPFENENWDAPTTTSPDGTVPNPWYYLPTPKDDAPPKPGDPPGVVFLDAVYPAAKNPDFAVLITDNVDPKVFHVVDARPASKSAYAISAKVTRLKLDGVLPDHTFPLRNTVILTGTELLTLQKDLPLPDPLTGNTLVLAGVYSKLQAGQKVVVRGNLYDSTTRSASQTLSAEAGILNGAPILDQENNITTVMLKESLTNSYARAGTVLLANIVDATQGETVRNEVLGSSDGSAFQAYPLKQKPLTYLPSQDPEGLSAVQSTLLVTVNNVRWNEQPTLLESPADAQDFTTTLDDNDQTTVIFGDGVNGARPPTGKNNIRARYRKGLGASGNVDTGAVQQLIDSAPGLQKVTNPLPALGGADRESISQIRVSAPGSLLTFGRAVSVEDYAALALSYPGVAKASAAWVQRDAITLQAISQPYVQLTVATANQTSLAQQKDFALQLRSFIDKRRDPNVPLRILDFTPVYIDVAATIDVKDAYPRQATVAAAQAALSPDNPAGYFSFEHLAFGQSIHLSAVYAVLQNVPGVSDALITTFRRLDQDHDSSVVRNDIFIRPTELAVIKNDPTDTGNLLGKLTIHLGKGGFIDS